MTAEPVLFRKLAVGDAGWLIQRHAEQYARGEGFDASFEALVAEILVDFLRHRDPARERAWFAVQGGRRLGRVRCVRQGDETAKLRLFPVEPEARLHRLGAGPGRPADGAVDP